MSTLNTSALNQVTIDLGTKDMITKTLLENTFVKSGVTVMTGFQPRQNVEIPVLDTTVQMQAGGTCDIGASGSNVLTTVSATLTPIAYRFKYCPADTQGVFLGLENKIGTAPESYGSTFEEALTISNLLGIKADVGTALLQSATSGTFSSSHTKFNGVLSNLLETSNVNSITFVGASYSTFNQSTAIPIIRQFCTSRTSGIKAKSRLGEKIYIWLDEDKYDIAIDSYVAADMYHYTGEEGSGEFKVPGFNIYLKATPELEGKNKIFMSYASNFKLLITSYEEMEGNSIKWVEDVVTENKWMKYDSSLAIVTGLAEDVVMWNKPD